MDDGIKLMGMNELHLFFPYKRKKSPKPNNVKYTFVWNNGCGYSVTLTLLLQPPGPEQAD
jgi:hypothetical protein